MWLNRRTNGFFQVVHDAARATWDKKKEKEKT